MAATDHPLKRLVSTFITEFASWLLSTPVHIVRPLNVELPADTLLTDQVFQVTLDNGRELVLHIEFQGRRSQTPMRWRMLEYMQRLAMAYRLPLWSVVFYVGAGSGVDDTGHHTISGPADIIPLVWQYQVVRLWQMSADELLALGQPALLALVGQTRIDRPAVVLPAVVARLRAVTDAEARGRLLTDLLALLPDEEMIAMVERLLEDETGLLDTPYLRRIREEGREEGALEMRRSSIVEALTVRFAPPPEVLQQVRQSLEAHSEETALAQLFTAAIRSTSLAAFQEALEQA
jgi:predicted transposase YdaD